MRPSLSVLSAVTLLVQGLHAYSTNYTSQNLASGTIQLGDWQDAYDRAKAFVDGLTTSEKISLITGSDVSNFTALYFRDSGNSILQYYYVTSWPLSSALAMTWDKDQMYQMYKALGDEFYAKGINVANGPVSEPLGRSPWGGRNGESFGPDSYLNGIAFGLSVKGYGAAGVISGAKHFLLNEQENNRTQDSTGGGGGGSPPSDGGNFTMPSGGDNSTSSPGGMGGGGDSSSTETTAYSSQVDDKTLHETYMWPFYDGVKAGLGAVMCSLNRVNETYACENQDLIGGMLKTEIGFPGFVFGDVGGQKTAFGSANAGMDYGSASTWSNSTITTGLNNGSLTDARLTDMAVRNVLPSYKLNQQDGTYPTTAGLEDYVDPRANHSKIARNIAASSLVLLKNTNNALPLNKPKSMSIFGVHAGAPIAGPNDPISVTGSDDVYQGHAASLGGSGTNSFPYLITPHYALTTKVIEDGTMFRWIMNDTGYSSSGSGLSGYSSGTGAAHTYAGYAADTEVCIVFLNAYSGEGADRSELYNTDQDAMVTDVASNCNNTIVVINAIATRLVDNWIENENVTALVYGGMLGQESGQAIVNVLYGDVNPSGKLTYTIAKNESDYNTGLCTDLICDFSEGNYIDYKYFDAYNVTPRYEFGFGLSYTSFEYGADLTVSKTNETALATKFAQGPRAVGGREDLWDVVATAETEVTNSGDRDGAEVVQLYVGFPDAAGQPLRQLRGFEKVHLAKGETAKVTFELRRRDLSYWDVEAQNWAVASGTYTFWVGASSRDLKSSAEVTI
ncbi:putative beta-glucosidase d protein [Lasiodiplodia theobromae]|uniref:beta-glucosidase n=1 Tax=Lasiodiplodia theobromae TaxID=45133 RepID=A0A5N5DMJ1_9PEZI|nr:Beta-glucosidase d [Lasiodiplodia theobromae]KAB2578820.1 putative beta-glucosidase D [Lasiodiplodia theobromae]KAF4535401.1 Beta-glucosidase d [Lasiodiplodia theobromae]KAF9638678.1 putative beta-glucosidase d protein [Lasiodiplodia theobromae]